MYCHWNLYLVRDINPPIYFHQSTIFLTKYLLTFCFLLNWKVWQKIVEFLYWNPLTFSKSYSIIKKIITQISLEKHSSIGENKLVIWFHKQDTRFFNFDVILSKFYLCNHFNFWLEIEGVHVVVNSDKN